MNPYRLRAYILLLIVSVIWAIAGPIIKFTLGGLDPFVFLTYRFAISTIAAIFCFLLTGFQLPKEKKLLLQIFLYGLMTSTITLGLLFWGLKETTVIEMSLMSVVGPILIAIAGEMFLNEHITKKERLGMGIAIFGMLFTILEPIIEGSGLPRFSGNFLILLYLLTNAVSVVLLKKLLREQIKPLDLANFSFIIGFLTTLPILLVKSTPTNILTNLQSLPFPYHLGVIYMALLSGNLAYTLGNKAHKTIEVSEAALFSYLYPILSIPIAVFWLKEKITLPFIIGAVIIIAGVVTAEYKRTKSENKAGN